VVRSDTRRAVEHVRRQPSTYARQLRAFTGAILRGEPVLTGPGREHGGDRRVLRSGWAPAARTEPLNLAAADRDSINDTEQ
jgi:hypothetical protein